MWKKQAELPFLPVPTLKESVPLFLLSIEPLVTPDVFNQTKKLCEDLLNDKNAATLQQLLEDKAKKCNDDVKAKIEETIVKGKFNKDALHPDGLTYPNTHWLESWWERLAYLAWPETLLWSNVFQVGFGCKPFPQRPLRRFAAVIVGLLDFRDLLLSGDLPMEPAGGDGKTLCNAQQLRILSAHRIPGEQCDRIVTDHYGYSHICVSCKGYWYQVQVIEKPNSFSNLANIITIDRLEKELERIQKDATERSNKKKAVPLAVLTTEDRPIWAKNRLLLQGTSEQNAEYLRSIETAICHLVISDLQKPPTTYTEGQLGCHRTDRGREIWMDKCVSYVGFSNGVSGIHIEHSCADAVVPSRMSIHAQVYATKYGGVDGVGYTHEDKKVLDKILAVPQTPFRGPSTWNGPAEETCVLSTTTQSVGNKKPWESSATAPGTHLLDFSIDEVIAEKVKLACANAEKVLSENHVVALDLPNKVIGDTGRIKNINLAPDSFMQMVLQLAFARDQPNDPVPATYETGMTRNFLHGRTETIRTQSIHSKQFATTFDDKSAPAKQKYEAIMKAAEHHRQYTKRAVAGKGCDRHFLALRMLAAENKIPSPALFAGEAYAKSVNYTLSTSQMPWGTPDHPGFCAPGDVAYGVCYRFVVGGGIIATVSSRGACKTKDAARFCKQIEKSAVDLMEFLEANTPKKEVKSKL